MQKGIGGDARASSANVHISDTVSCCVFYPLLSLLGTKARL